MKKTNKAVKVFSIKTNAVEAAVWQVRGFFYVDQKGFDRVAVMNYEVARDLVLSYMKPQREFN